MKNTWKNVASIDDKQTENPKGEQDFPFYFFGMVYTVKQ
jgi:hypothetical protein